MQKKVGSEKKEESLINLNEIILFLGIFPKYFRLEDLRVKLEKEGYSNISYVVVNHQEISARLKYIHLKNKVSEYIAVYQQEENQTDIWTLLNGSKDDFLIYDRCVHTCTHTLQIKKYLLCI